jgi:hypothetical protein
MAHAAPAAATVAGPDAETATVELLKATYFNDVDTKNWLALRQLFAPDAVVDTTGSFGPYFPNRDSFIAFTSLTLSAINTRHQGYDPQIDLTSDTTASAVWTMQDRLSLAGLVTIHGYGHYTDNYEEVNGQWRITYSKLTRTGFALEFPAFQNFATGLANAYKPGHRQHPRRRRQTTRRCHCKQLRGPARKSSADHGAARVDGRDHRASWRDRRAFHRFLGENFIGEDFHSAYIGGDHEVIQFHYNAVRGRPGWPQRKTRPVD